MESLISGFVQFSSTTLEKILVARLSLHSIFSPKSKVILQQINRLIHSTFGDNPTLIIFGDRKTKLKCNKVLRYFVRDCLENLLLFPFSLRFHEHSKLLLFWKKKKIDLFMNTTLQFDQLVFNAKFVLECRVQNRTF